MKFMNSNEEIFYKFMSSYEASKYTSTNESKIHERLRSPKFMTPYEESSAPTKPLFFYKFMSSYEGVRPPINS